MAEDAWRGKRISPQGVESTVETEGLSLLNRDRIVGAIVGILKKGHPLSPEGARKVLLNEHGEFEEFVGNDAVYLSVMDHMLDRGYFDTRSFSGGVLRLTANADDLLYASVSRRKSQRHDSKQGSSTKQY